ncbi:MAG: DUF4261 domain-containing protein [Myxococcota bacterium]|nr:DUF4261 domain-containing protein [Myxococcota bacterium]
MSSSPATAMAMVLLDRAVMPDAARVVAWLGGRRRASISSTSATTIELDVEGRVSMLGMVDAPVPWSQLEGPCSTAWWWPQASEECRTSTAHLVVTATSERDLFEATLRLTDVVAAVAEAARAVAVYWSASAMVHEPGAFRTEAESATRESLPLRLWIDFRMEPTRGDELFFATTGLETFGLMELECVGTRASAPHVLDRMFDVAHYLCDRGPVLEDGQTIGRSDAERISARHRPSRWKRPGKVIFLELGR